MLGYLIPRNYMDAMQFDKANHNSRDGIHAFLQVFKKWGKAIFDRDKKVINTLKGYHKIKVCLVFDVKFDGKIGGRWSPHT